MLTKNNWFCSHGFEDEVLPYSVSKEQVERLQEGGFHIDFRSYHKSHTILREEIEEIRLWIQSKI